MKQVTIQVTGAENNVLDFVALCAKINMLGQREAERTINLTVRGDIEQPLTFQTVGTQLGDVEVDLIQHCSDRIGEVFNRIIDRTSYMTPLSHTI